MEMKAMSHSDRENATESSCSPETTDQGKGSCVSGMTLENIVDKTGELEHLNELVMIHLKKRGGFTTPEAYFTAIEPVLDMLEIELRVRCASAMTLQQVKLVVQDWIDGEIRELTR
jgi:hypothetical protein